MKLPRAVQIAGVLIQIGMYGLIVNKWGIVASLATLAVALGSSMERSAYEEIKRLTSAQPKHPEATTPEMREGKK